MVKVAPKITLPAIAKLPCFESNLSSLLDKETLQFVPNFIKEMQESEVANGRSLSRRREIARFPRDSAFCIPRNRAASAIATESLLSVIWRITGGIKNGN